mgnify:CR=1 FL=1
MRKFYTQRVMRLWHRLPGEDVGASSLEAFEVRLDGALGSLSCWVETLPMTGGLVLGCLLKSLPMQAIP